MTRTPGQQPVVAWKEGNASRAKGQSQSKENKTSLSVERQGKTANSWSHSIEEKNYEGSETEGRSEGCFLTDIFD